MCLLYRPIPWQSWVSQKSRPCTLTRQSIWTFKSNRCDTLCFYSSLACSVMSPRPYKLVLIPHNVGPHRKGNVCNTLSLTQHHGIIPMGPVRSCTHAWHTPCKLPFLRCCRPLLSYSMPVTFELNPRSLH